MRELHCGQTGVFALSGFVLRCAIAMGSICVGSGMSPNGWVKSRWGEKVFVYKGLVEPHCASSNYIHVCVWRSFVMQLTRVGHEGQMISNLFRGSRVLMAFHAMGFIYTKGIADSILCALFLNSQKSGKIPSARSHAVVEFIAPRFLTPLISHHEHLACPFEKR